MTPAQLIRALHERDVRVIAGRDRPILDGTLGSITDDLVHAACQYRWLFIWGLEGTGSGHNWHACDACDQVQLLHRRSQPVRCSLTPHCLGYMHQLPDIFHSPAKPAAITAITTNEGTGA